MITFIKKGFPGGSEGKAFACNAGDLGSIPGLGRFPGGGCGSVLQCSCLENLNEQRSLVGSDMTERIHFISLYKDFLIHKEKKKGSAVKELIYKSLDL